MSDKTPRKDKLKNIATVGPKILADPLKTERELEEETGIGKSTINRIKQELGQAGAKSEFVLEILDKDKAIIRRGLEIIEEKLFDEELVKKIKPSEVSTIIKENTSRYMLFAGEATDKDGAVKQPSLTEKQQKALDALLDLYK